MFYSRRNRKLGHERPIYEQSLLLVCGKFMDYSQGREVST